MTMTSFAARAAVSMTKPTVIVLFAALTELEEAIVFVVNVLPSTTVKQAKKAESRNILFICGCVCVSFVLGIFLNVRCRDVLLECSLQGCAA